MLVGLVLKFVPEIVIGVFGDPIVGVNDVMVGGPCDAATVKEDELVALPLPATEMLIAPVVAPLGTTADSSVLDDDVTTAACPLN